MNFISQSDYDFITIAFCYLDYMSTDYNHNTNYFRILYEDHLPFVSPSDYLNITIKRHSSDYERFDDANPFISVNFKNIQKEFNQKYVKSVMNDVIDGNIQITPSLNELENIITKIKNIRLSC